MSPGVINTPIISLSGDEREDHFDNSTKNNLISRAGTADECAQGIVSFIQNDFVTGKTLTGTTLDVDDGCLLCS